MRILFAFLLCCIYLYANDIQAKLETACKSDYESCLTLAVLYDAKSNIDITKMIHANTKTGRLINASQSYKEILQQEKFSSDQKLALSYYEKALPLLESACYYNYDIRACLIISCIYESNVIVGKNTLKSARLVDLALEHSTRACVLDTSKGNTQYQYMQECQLLNKYSNYVKDIFSKVSILEDNCKRSDLSACYKALLFYYLRSSDAQADISQDSKKSIGLMQRICGLSATDCVSIRSSAIMYNPSATSCFIKGDMHSCIKAGDILSDSLYNENIRSINTESAFDKTYPFTYINLLTLSCDNGNLWACYHTRFIPSVASNKRKYAAILRKSCKYGILQACIEATNRYKNGELFDKDYKVAITFASSACSISMRLEQVDPSIVDYCYFAGNELESGDNVPQDVRKALDFYSFTCIATKSLESCKRAISLQDTMKKAHIDIIAIHKIICDISKEVNSCNIATNAYYDSRKQTEWVLKTYIKLLDNPLLSKKDMDIIKMKISNINSGRYDSVVRDYTQVYYNSEYVHFSYPNLSTLCGQKDYIACINMADILNSKWRIDTDSNHSADSKDRLDSIEKDINNFWIDTRLKPYDLYIESCLNKQQIACDRLVENVALTFNKSASNTIEMPFNFSPYIHKLSSICRANKDKESIDNACISMAVSALDNKQYDYVIDIFNDRYSIDSILDGKDGNAKKILDMLVESYFNTARYEDSLYIYKIMYRNHIPSDYKYLVIMYEKGLGVTKSMKIAKDILNSSTLQD